MFQCGAARDKLLDILPGRGATTLRPHAQLHRGEHDQHDQHDQHVQHVQHDQQDPAPPV